MLNRAAPRSDARANRERIIEAAQELFGERGTGAEMRDIAERAGVAVGTIYRNYPTKGALIAAVLSDVIREGTEKAVAAEALPDPIAALQALLEAVIDMAERYGWLAEAMISGQFQELSREKENGRLYKNDLATRFQRLIGMAAANGRIDARVDPEITSVLIAGATSSYSFRPLLEKRSGHEIAAAILGCVLGLESNGSAASPVRMN